MDDCSTSTSTVFVDSGTLWIGDGCYVLGDDASHRVRSWSEMSEKIDRAAFHEDGVASPLGKGLGCIVQSGFGDGAYDLTVERELGRVRKITIEFFSSEKGTADATT